MINKIYIAGNWKMNKGIRESVDFLRSFSNAIGSDRIITKLVGEKLEILLFPPISSLYSMKKEEKFGYMSFGVQNIYWKESGAFTGENSALMALEAGAAYVLVGHSERRHLFGEDENAVRKKLKSCINTGLKAVLCVGETSEERKNGLTGSVLERQVKNALDSVDHAETKNPLMIAYEPVWAIGTGNNATGEDAQRSCSMIRALLERIYDEETANRTVLLYGGSVNASNALEFLFQKDINGLLVGGASLDCEQFMGIIQAAASLF